MTKSFQYAFSAILIILILSLTFLVPGGAVTQEAEDRYYEALDAAWDDEGITAAEGIARLKPRAILASAVFSDILPSADVEPLPIDLSVPGSTPRTDGFSVNGYRDETLIVEMEQRRLFDSDVFIAYVKTAVPSQFRTAVAGKSIRSNSSAKTTRIASSFNAVVAMNGDYYPNTKAGYIYREGQKYREQASENMDLLLVDELGDLHIIEHGKANQKQAVSAYLSHHKIINGFFFGPGLVVDGEVREIPENYQFDPHGRNPRAGIAQLGPLTYALVVVNGRTEASAGVTLSEFADIMKEIGAIQAYNLDGGNSATLVFNGGIYNDKPQAERSVTDIIYFASAIGE